MRKLIPVLSVGFVVALIAIVAGCSDRGTNRPLSTFDQNHGYFPTAATRHVFDFPGFYYQPLNPNGLLLMTAYLPKPSTPPPIGSSEPVPLLVLVAPSFGGADFFFENGLFEMAEDMIEKGEIEPMAIVCIGNDELFGGFFYGNSIYGGFYDQALGDELLAYLRNKFPSIKSGPENTGIAGFGMGAYGAFRAIIQNPGRYSAISVTDGPLDFDGANPTAPGGRGLIDLFQPFVDLQAAAGRTQIRQFDTNSTQAITSLIFGGALTFSPSDTAATLVDSIETVGSGIPTGNRFSLLRNVQSITDSTTLVPRVYERIVVDAPSEASFTADVHLPFDVNGTAYGPIWSLWMQNNLDTLATAAGPGVFDGVGMYFATTIEAPLEYHQMTQSWLATLQGAPYSVQPQVFRYTGYEGNPADNQQYTYDILRRMLKFHSDRFAAAN